MYTVTFYSFKGGVGRTLALINTAWELASRGKKVFVMDFDLEAPGISVVSPFCECTEKPGLVEYVNEYLRTSAAPLVDEYVCEVPARNVSGNLLFMRAGKHNAYYQQRFAEIDWSDLYAKKEGYLLFEDLKEQIQTQYKPDYLLIDSRTGHTDTAGICTRQLPDAVVLLFLPNEQNLAGLGGIVKAIRDESGNQRQHRIQLHFVPSNVPSLDDEDGILEKRLQAFQNTLEYPQPTAVLYHYDSLQLLDKEVFIQKRPNSALAKQYRDLTNAIVSKNMEDAGAAIDALTETQALLARPDKSGEQASMADVEAVVDQIAQIHSTNGEIQFRIALIRMRLNEWQGAESLLTSAIKLGHARAQVFLNRAQVRQAQKRLVEAGEDLIATLRSKDASSRDLSLAATWLKDVPSHFLATLGKSVDELPFDPEKLIHIANALLYSPEALKISISICNRILASVPGESDIAIDAHIHSAMCEVGLARFSHARERLEFIMSKANNLASKGAIGSPQIVRGAFNYAMASWGESGNFSKDHFSTIVILSGGSQPQTLNHLQCMAVAHGINGSTATAYEYLTRAIRLLASNPKSDFSCWRYCEVGPNEFLKDLTEIGQLIAGQESKPHFLSGQAELLH